MYTVQVFSNKLFKFLRKNTAAKTILSLQIIIFVLFGCFPSSSSGSPIVSGLTNVGQPEIKEISTTNETIPNCSGGTTTTVKHPSYATTSTHSVEWNVGGELGTGFVIGEGVLPAGVEISSAFNFSNGNGISNSIEQTNAWDLPAEPNSIHEYSIKWQEVWQAGYIDVTFSDNEIFRVDVKYRSAILSDIVEDKLLNCDGSLRKEGLTNGDGSTSSTGNSTDSSSQTNSTVNCIAKEQGPLAQSDHYFEGPIHVIQLWRQNENTSWGSDELMALVIGNVNIVAAGGNVWTYPSEECEAVAIIHMQDGANQRGSRILSESEMRAEGLIK